MISGSLGLRTVNHKVMETTATMIKKIVVITQQILRHLCELLLLVFMFGKKMKAYENYLCDRRIYIYIGVNLAES